MAFLSVFVSVFVPMVLGCGGAEHQESPPLYRPDAHRDCCDTDQLLAEFTALLKEDSLPGIRYAIEHLMSDEEVGALFRTIPALVALIENEDLSLLGRLSDLDGINERANQVADLVEHYLGESDYLSVSQALRGMVHLCLGKEELQAWLDLLDGGVFTSIGASFLPVIEDDHSRRLVWEKLDVLGGFVFSEGMLCNIRHLEIPRSDFEVIIQMVFGDEVKEPPLDLAMQTVLDILDLSNPSRTSLAILSGCYVGVSALPTQQTCPSRDKEQLPDSDYYLLTVGQRLISELFNQYELSSNNRERGADSSLSADQGSVVVSVPQTLQSLLKLLTEREEIRESFVRLLGFALDPQVLPLILNDVIMVIRTNVIEDLIRAVYLIFSGCEQICR